MPNTTLLTFDVQDRRARAAFPHLKREIEHLDREFGTTRRAARAAGEAIDALDAKAQQSTTHIVRLNTAVQRINATWQGTNARLRDAHDRFVSTRQDAEQLTHALDRLHDSRTRSRTALAAREMFEFGGASVRAAAQIDGFRGGLQSNAEGTRDAHNISINPQQVVAAFQAALAASNAYYNARIANAQNALAQETEGTEADNTLQTRIFELGRQRLQAEQQMTAENQRLLQQLAQERIDAATAASTAEVDGFKAAAQAGQAYTDQLSRQINAIPPISSPDAQSGHFTSELRKDFEETERQGRSLLDVMRQIANYAFTTDLDERIPDPIVRGAALDQRIATEARGARTFLEIRQEAGEQGRQFLNRVGRSEERDIQKSIRERARSYRQFANLVSNTFLELATGRAENFETVATEFIRQSIRMITRAFVEHQIRGRLDDQLTAARIANIQKVSAAQAAVGAGGFGNLAGLGNLSGLGRLSGPLAGGGLAIGASALLFPEQIKNTVGGVSDLIRGFLSNVSSLPDRAFGPPEVFLKIGDQEIKDITDIQDSLREENRV